MSKVYEMKNRIDHIRGMKPVIHEGDGTIDWNELGPVHTEILEELCNDLWQLVHPGRENDWTMPAKVFEHIRDEIAGLRQALDNIRLNTEGITERDDPRWHCEMVNREAAKALAPWEED